MRWTGTSWPSAGKTSSAGFVNTKKQGDTKWGTESLKRGEGELNRLGVGKIGNAA